MSENNNITTENTQETSGQHHERHHRHHSSHHRSSGHSSHTHSSGHGSSSHHHRHRHHSEKQSEGEKNINISNKTDASSEHIEKKHYSSHHRHHSSGSHKHHKSRSSRKSSGIKAFFTRLAHKLSPKKSYTHKKLQKIATSTKKDKRHEYAVISKRVLFGVLMLVVFVYAFWTLIQENENTDLKNASYTPSENSQLKIQVMQLQQEKEELQNKLNKYIELYGELEEEPDEEKNK